MKKVCKAMATFAASLETADNNWKESKVPKHILDSTKKTIEENGGIDCVMMMLAILITEPEQDEEDYPTINFLKNEEK